jgi:hypothetical protein
LKNELVGTWGLNAQLIRWDFFFENLLGPLQMFEQMGPWRGALRRSQSPQGIDIVAGKDGSTIAPLSLFELTVELRLTLPSTSASIGLKLRLTINLVKPAVEIVQKRISRGPRSALGIQVTRFSVYTQAEDRLSL